MDINNLTPEQRKRAETLAEEMFISWERQDKLEKLSNKELADLLLNKVWVDISLFGEQSDIVGAAVDRLNDE